jgi:hypothetical protein
MVRSMEVQFAWDLSVVSPFVVVLSGMDRWSKRDEIAWDQWFAWVPSIQDLLWSTKVQFGLALSSWVQPPSSMAMSVVGKSERAKASMGLQW